MSEKFDIYEAVTNRMIEQLESGIIPWERPWTGVTSGAIKHKTGKPYSLINQLMLGDEGEYLSFLECKKAGGSIRTGAKSRMVVFFKFQPYAKQDADGNIVLDGDGNMIIRTRPILRYSSVFHINDCEGIAPKWEGDSKPKEIESDANAESVLADYLKRSGVTLHNVKQNKAYYSPLSDSITLPLKSQFAKPGEYYSTAFHEATHSTGHQTRLNRFTVSSSVFGDEDYSREELVAEIGAAAILHELGIETDSTFRNSSAYVQSWLKALRNDTRMIVTAAGRAEKAARLILNLQPEQEENAA